MTLFGFSVLFTVTDGIYDELNEVFDAQDIIIPEELNAYDQMNYVIRMGMEFLLVLSVVILFLSSAIQKQTLQSYIVSFISTLIISSLLIFLLTHIYNIFTVHSTVIDLTIIPAWFITNFAYIFVLNIIAGLVSFIFAIRSSNTEVGFI